MDAQRERDLTFRDIGFVLWRLGRGLCAVVGAQFRLAGLDLSGRSSLRAGDRRGDLALVGGLVCHGVGMWRCAGRRAQRLHVQVSRRAARSLKRRVERVTRRVRRVGNGR